MKIIAEKTLEINLDELQDGQIAVITKWPTREYVGEIVQRFGESMVRLGYSWGKSWPCIFKPDQLKSVMSSGSAKVRVLAKGSTLEV